MSSSGIIGGGGLLEVSSHIEGSHSSRTVGKKSAAISPAEMFRPTEHATAPFGNDIFIIVQYCIMYVK